MSAIMFSFKTITSIFILYIFCNVFVSTAPTNDKSNQVPSHGIDQSIINDIDTFIEDLMKCKPSAALGLSVVKDGHVVMSKGYGYSSMDTREKVTSSTRFGIGSLSKAFGALLVAKFVNDNDDITMDTPIIEYIPDFYQTDEYRSTHASLRDLLGHRMGLPMFGTPYLSGLDPNITRKEFAKKIRYIKNNVPFRAKMEYSNLMYITIGEILEQLSGGKSWENLMKEWIFEPLGMSNSGFVDLQKDFSQFALPADFVNGTMIDLMPELLMTAHVAGTAGTIYSTPDDFAKWMIYLLSYSDSTTDSIDDQITAKGIYPSLVQMNFEPSITVTDRLYPTLSIPSSPISHVQDDYCQGWISAYYRGYKEYFHTGGIVTYSSALALYPDVNIGIYLNLNGPMQEQLSQGILYYVSDKMLGLPTWFNISRVCDPKKPAPWYPFMSAPEDNTVIEAADVLRDIRKYYPCRECVLTNYVGTYTHKVWGTASVSLKSSGSDTSSDYLYFSFGRYGFMNLTPYTTTTFYGELVGPISFYDSHYDGDFNAVEFEFDEEGKEVKSLKFKFHGMEFLSPFVKETQ